MTQLNKLSLTSDRDYLKIFDDGAITMSANGTPDADSSWPADFDAPFGLSGNHVINHNLGSVPLVRAFYDPNNTGMWYNTKGRTPANFFMGNDPWLKYLATSSYVKLMLNTDGGAKNNRNVFYRIYDMGSKSVDSDSRVDKIFLKDTASGTAPGSPNSMDFAETVLTIPHGQNEPILWSIQFAESPSGPWYYEGTDIIGPPDTNSGPPGGPYSRYYMTTAWARADNDNLYIHLQSNYPSSRLLYVRYVCDYRV